jgi:hypothetical protein
MNEKYSKTATVSFILGYLPAYYLIIWLGNTIFSDTVANSMAVLGGYETKLKIVLLGTPIVAMLFGSLAAGVFTSSYTTMGSRRLGPPQYFTIGWACFCIANGITASAGLQLFVDETVGREWIRQIGNIGFNTWFFLLAPTFGYLIGIFISALAGKLIEAQNS